MVRSTERSIEIWPGSTGRSTEPESSLSGSSLGRPDGRQLGKHAWGCRPLTPDRWPVDQAVDRQVSFDLFWAPTTSFSRPYKYGFFEASFNQDFLEQFFLSFQVFLTKFSKEFLCQNSLFLFVSKFWKKSKKYKFCEFYFFIHFSHLSRSISQVFSLLILFQILLFLPYLSYQFKSIL